MRGRGSPLRATAPRLLVVLAAVAAPLLVAPAGAGAQGAAGLCTMDVFPQGVGFSLGPHTVQVRMFCEPLPEGSDQYSDERLRITSSDPIADFASLETATCSVGVSEVECPLLLGETSSSQELYGELRFQDPTEAFSPEVSAQYTTVDQNGFQETHDVTVSQLVQGSVYLGRNPKKCLRRDFKIKVQISAGLRSQLLEMVTFGGEVSDEVPQFVATLTRKGKTVSREPRLADLKYKSDLKGFKISVPASRLPSGKYEVPVYLELNHPDDYPSDALSFKRC
jgi:hypothetical protein